MSKTTRTEKGARKLEKSYGGLQIPGKLAPRCFGHPWICMAIFKLFFLSPSAEFSKTGVHNSFLIPKVNFERICVATAGISVSPQGRSILGMLSIRFESVIEGFYGSKGTFVIFLSK